MASQKERMKRAQNTEYLNSVHTKSLKNVSYDHGGIKNCLFGDFTEKINERISKGHRCFNALSSLVHRDSSGYFW